MGRIGLVLRYMEAGHSGRVWRGRGVAENPGNRFENAHFEPAPEWEADEERSAPRTQFLPELSVDAFRKSGGRQMELFE